MSELESKLDPAAIPEAFEKAGIDTPEKLDQFLTRAITPNTSVTDALEARAAKAEADVALLKTERAADTYLGTKAQLDALESANGAVSTRIVNEITRLRVALDKGELIVVPSLAEMFVVFGGGA